MCYALFHHDDDNDDDGDDNYCADCHDADADDDDAGPAHQSTKAPLCRWRRAETEAYARSVFVLLSGPSSSTNQEQQLGKQLQRTGKEERPYVALDGLC